MSKLYPVKPLHEGRGNMNVDLGFLEWCLGGILTIGAMVSGYLYRELKEADREIGKELSEFKTYVAGAYSPRAEIKDIVADLKREMRENTENIKDFIEAKIKS